MSMKTRESRIEATTRCTRGDIEPLDTEDEQRLASAEWRRRQRAARQQREVLVAQIDEKIIEPGLDLQDEAIVELGIIRFPDGVDDLIADLAEDPEIGGGATLLLAVQEPLLADLAAA